MKYPVQKYVEIADKNNLVIHLNLMKTYALDILSLSKSIKQIKEWLYIVYVVDSAGCMLPNNGEYVSFVNETNFNIGLWT